MMRDANEKKERRVFRILMKNMIVTSFLVGKEHMHQNREHNFLNFNGEQSNADFKVEILGGSPSKQKNIKKEIDFFAKNYEKKNGNES